MPKFTWSEQFRSIEGEGAHAGKGTLYTRFSRCNFECRGFNNPTLKDTTTVEGIGFDPAKFTKLAEIPPIKIGCDSIYSWDPKFKHMWTTGDEGILIDELLGLSATGSWKLPGDRNNHYIWSITGGEPTLHWKTLPAIWNHPRMADCKHILIETNCAVPFKREFVMEINKWLSQDKNRKWTWSNSPKLRASGEKWEEAIRPDIAILQTLVSGPEFSPSQVEQYFKFVCDGSDESFDEVDRAMAMYYAAGIPRNVEVFIMPAACQEEDQQAIASAVANKCLERGYAYCHRVHLSVYGNTVGT